MTGSTAWGALGAHATATLDDAAAWLDHALPDRARAKAARLVVLPEDVLLRSLVLPQGAVADARAIIASRMDAWSPWPAADTIWRHAADPADACRFHIAIFSQSQLAAWRHAMPDAVRIETRVPESSDWLVLEDKAPRRRKIRKVLSRSVWLCLIATLGFATLCASAAWVMETAAKRKEAQILALSPQSQAPGEAALLAGYVSRKASERSAGATMLHVARGLPDQAWASSLEFKPGYFRVTGFAETLDGLLENLEADDALANARFSASAEKDAASGRFTFSVEGDVLSSSTGAP